MAEGAWEPTAELLAMHANINREPKSSAHAAAEFNPYATHRPQQPTISMRSLRKVFAKRKAKKK